MKKSFHSLARREAITFYACISPWLIGFVLFVLGPMVASILISFTRWDFLGPAKFVGLQNYQKMLSRDRLFWHSLKVTAIYTGAYVPLQLVGGLALALIMDRKLRFIGVFRTIYYLPSVLPGVAFVVLCLDSPDFFVFNDLRIRAPEVGGAWAQAGRLSFLVPTWTLVSGLAYGILVSVACSRSRKRSEQARQRRTL